MALMKVFRILILSVALSLGTLGGLRAQNVWAVKTNLLSDATTNLNLALEFAIAPHWSMEMSATLNNWPIKSLNVRYGLVQPAVRLWFCEHFSGGFVSAYAIGGHIHRISGLPDLSKYWDKLPNWKDFSLQHGMMLGGGLSIGYAFVLGRHWNLELEAGGGYLYVRGLEYYENTLVSDRSVFDYWGPTKLALNLVYLF